MFTAKNRLFTISCQMVVGLLLFVCAQGETRAAEPAPSPTPKPTGGVNVLLGDGSVRFCSQAETLQFNLAYNEGLGPLGSRISVRPRLRDLNGRIVYVGTNETITINGMHTESVKRQQLPVPQTGALALVADWLVSGAPADVAELLPRSAEVLDTCSGRVLFHAGAGLSVQYRPVPGSDELAIDILTTPVSFTYGQTLRLSLGQQWPLGVPQPTAAAAGDFFLDLKGIDGESETGVMQGRANFLPGQALTLSFNRDGLAALGDAGTGRLTAQVVVRYRAKVSPAVLAQLWNANTLPQFPGSLQLTDNNHPSACLIGLLLPAVQKSR